MRRWRRGRGGGGFAESGKFEFERERDEDGISRVCVLAAIFHCVRKLSTHSVRAIRRPRAATGTSVEHCMDIKYDCTERDGQRAVTKQLDRTLHLLHSIAVRTG